MNRIPILVGIACFALAAISSVLVAVYAARAIEERSVQAVADALTLDGMDWVEVSADGLQVFLDGTAPDEATNFRAVSLAAGVVSADRVVNRMEVARADTAAPPRFSLDMLRNGDGISLIGLVPADTGAEPVTDAIEAIADGVDVTNMIETADFPAPATWAAALDYGLRALQELPRSKVTIYGDRVEVQAVSESPSERAAFIARLERGQPDGVQVVLDISAPRPVITPFTLRFVIDEAGARFETCAADTLEARSRILNAAQAAGAEGLLVCPVGLGVPSPQWAAAVEAALAALADLGAGTVSFSDADITIFAAEGTDQDDFDRVIGELAAALPAVFSLDGVMPQAPSGEELAGPARFLATLDEEGVVSLRGRLPEGPLGTSVEAFAIALFGVENTDIATRAVPELPERWSLRVMAGLQALSRLNDGSLTVEPGDLILSGRTGNTDTLSDITRLLSEELGQSGEFTLDVAYVEALDPIASRPTAEECVGRIQAIQDENKIVFEPGSISLTDEAGRILDRIAEILPECQHVRMEISGHTDSQGREQMNLNLSQARAEAVLSGLLARDVLVSNLTAQGYGETQPIADNETEAGRERNRRIEFRLLSEAVAGVVEEVVEEIEAQRPPPPPADIRPEPRPDSIAEAAAAAAEEEE